MPDDSPLTSVVIVVSLHPLAVFVEVVLLYVPLVIPYSNHAVVVPPLALTVPLRVAELDFTFVAESVVAVGFVGVVPSL